MSFISDVVARFRKSLAVNNPAYYSETFQRYQFPRWKFFKYADEGYRKNSIVFTCVRAVSLALLEPKLVVLHRDTLEPLPKHPLQLLIDNPNPDMNFAEIMMHVGVYSALGGTAFLHKERSRFGKVVNIYPYSIGNIHPIVSGGDWLSYYEYSSDGSVFETIPKADIVQINYPSIDPLNPTRGLAPLEAVAAEVDVTNELSGYIYSVLKNDAVVRGLVTVHQDSKLTADQQAQLREDLKQNFGGQKRGGTMFLTGNAKYEKIGLGLNELDVSNIRKIPESAIAGAFGIPAIVAGLPIGLDRSTYANFEQASKAFTEKFLVPYWQLIASSITSSFQLDYGSDFICSFDLSGVQSLKQDQSARQIAKSSAVLNLQTSFSTGALTREQAVENAVQLLDIKRDAAELLFPERAVVPAGGPGGPRAAYQNR
jgi:HK97 family phage portal protein